MRAGKKCGRTEKYALVALAVMTGLLLGLGIDSFSRLKSALQATRIQTAEAQVVEFEKALLAFRNDTGRFPGRDEGLGVLVHHTGEQGWRGPYLAGLLPEDPWGRTYLYLAQESNLAIKSAGPDGRFGSADDIGEIITSEKNTERHRRARVALIEGEHGSALAPILSQREKEFKESQKK